MSSYKKRDKDRYKLPISASHLVLYVIIGLYVLIVIGAVVAITYLFVSGMADVATNLTIALFSFAGAISAVAVGFYEWKAKSENEAQSANRKYETRLDLAMKIYNNCRDGKLDTNSVAMLQALISDSDTSVITSGLGATVVDEIKYGVSNMQNFTDGLG